MSTRPTSTAFERKPGGSRSHGRTVSDAQRLFVLRRRARLRSLTERRRERRVLVDLSRHTGRSGALHPSSRRAQNRSQTVRSSRLSARAGSDASRAGWFRTRRDPDHRREGCGGRGERTRRTEHASPLRPRIPSAKRVPGRGLRIRFSNVGSVVASLQTQLEWWTCVTTTANGSGKREEAVERVVDERRRHRADEGSDSRRLGDARQRCLRVGTEHELGGRRRGATNTRTSGPVPNEARGATAGRIRSTHNRRNSLVPRSRQTVSYGEHSSRDLPSLSCSSGKRCRLDRGSGQHGDTKGFAPWLHHRVVLCRTRSGVPPTGLPSEQSKSRISLWASAASRRLSSSTDWGPAAEPTRSRRSTGCRRGGRGRRRSVDLACHTGLEGAGATAATTHDSVLRR